MRLLALARVSFEERLERDSAIGRASRIDPSECPLDVAKRLGADRDISCQVTTPFCLWAASRRPDEYEAALWDSLSIGGDRDTHAAIVGGLLAARLGTGVPETWRAARQKLPSWVPSAG